MPMTIAQSHAVAAWKWRRLLTKLRNLHRSLALRGIRGTWSHVGRLLSAPAVATPSGPQPQVRAHAPHGASRPLVLVVDAVMPDPARDSGSVRMLEILRLLDELGWQVAFAPDSGRAATSECDLLLSAGVDEVVGVAGATGLPDWLRAKGGRLDAVLLCRHGVAAMHLPLVRQFAPAARVLFDTVDLHFLREQRTAELAHDPHLLKMADRSRQAELRLAANSDVTFVVSPVEQALLARECPQARVALLSNIHSVHGRETGFASRRGLLFVGGFGHPPNRDAAYWLVEEILPQVHRRLPGYPLHLVGEIPKEDRERLARDHVVLHGRVPDLRPFFENSLVSVAPLRAGAGVKGKINSAMSHGVPVVATRVAAEGMYLADGENVLLADTPAQFASAIASLADDAMLWEKLSTNAMDNIRTHFSREQARDVLRAALDSGT